VNIIPPSSSQITCPVTAYCLWHQVVNKFLNPFFVYFLSMQLFCAWILQLIKRYIFEGSCRLGLWKQFINRCMWRSIYNVWLDVEFLSTTFGLFFSLTYLCGYKLYFVELMGSVFTTVLLLPSYIFISSLVCDVQTVHDFQPLPEDQESHIKHILSNYYLQYSVEFNVAL
jgi:hypothetical protein